MRGPADQTRRGQLFELRDLFLGELLDAVLFRVRRDYLEIAALTEREQRVARAPARMNSAECGAHASMLLYGVYTAIEIVTAE